MTQLSAQTLKKGAVIAIRNYTFTLQPDVTMNQCLDFWTNKYIPACEKNYPGTRLFLLSGDRGEKKINLLNYAGYALGNQLRGLFLK
jgi:hypothetical protein